jgi:hypothetical protein
VATTRLGIPSVHFNVPTSYLSEIQFQGSTYERLFLHIFMMNWLKYGKNVKIRFEFQLQNSEFRWAGPGNLRNQKAR